MRGDIGLVCGDTDDSGREMIADCRSSQNKNTRAGTSIGETKRSDLMNAIENGRALSNALKKRTIHEKINNK